MESANADKKAPNPQQNKKHKQLNHLEGVLCCICFAQYIIGNYTDLNITNSHQALQQQAKIASNNTNIRRNDGRDMCMHAF